MISTLDLDNVDQSNVAGHVEALAKLNEITASKTNIDFVANKFAELSGNTVYDDNILRLCLMLARKSIISNSDAMQLIYMHLKNKRSV